MILSTSEKKGERRKKQNMQTSYTEFTWKQWMLFTKGKTYLLPKQADNLCTSNKHTKAVCQAHFSWYRKKKKKEYYDFEK